MRETFSDSKNYYEVLEVEPGATQQDIQTAYQRAKNAYTTDSLAMYSLMTQSECDSIIELIDEAYTVLGDPSKRHAYDEARGIKQTTKTNHFTQAESIQPTTKGPDDSLESLARKVAAQKEQDFNIRSKEADVSKMTALSRYKLDYNVDHVIEEEIEKCEEFTGEFLKKIREYKEVDIQRMADMTRISKTHLKNIENEDTDHLPAHVYIRGFIYQYAKTLKLNPEIVTASYLRRIKNL